MGADHLRSLHAVNVPDPLKLFENLQKIANEEEQPRLVKAEEMYLVIK